MDPDVLRVDEPPYEPLPPRHGLDLVQEGVEPAARGPWMELAERPEEGVHVLQAQAYEALVLEVDVEEPLVGSRLPELVHLLVQIVGLACPPRAHDSDALAGRGELRIELAWNVWRCPLAHGMLKDVDHLLAPHSATYR